MNKTFLLVLIILISGGSLLLAQFTPYGSARMGTWYEVESEDWIGVEDGRFNLRHYLQVNSFIGADFVHRDIQGKVEFGSGGGIRLLWAKHEMDNFNLIIGRDETLLNYKGSMNWNHENRFSGWGGIDDGRRAQVRLEFDSGLTIALLQTSTIDLQGVNQLKSAILPKINVRYTTELSDNANFSGALGINHFSYLENDGQVDEGVFSYILGLLLDIDLDPMIVKLHANLGQNTGNYGIDSQTINRAFWDGAEGDVINITTMGGFGELYYPVDEKTDLILGLSFTTSNSNELDNADSAMAVFGQIKYNLASNVWLSPEIGLLNRMKDAWDNDDGTMFYFGTQLRMDF